MIILPQKWGEETGEFPIFSQWSLTLKFNLSSFCPRISHPHPFSRVVTPRQGKVSMIEHENVANHIINASLTAPGALAHCLKWHTSYNAPGNMICSNIVDFDRTEAGLTSKFHQQFNTAIRNSLTAPYNNVQRRQTFDTN